MPLVEIAIHPLDLMELMSTTPFMEDDYEANALLPRGLVQLERHIYRQDETVARKPGKHFIF